MPAQANVFVYGYVFCGKKPVAGAKVKLEVINDQMSVLAEPKLVKLTTNSAGIWSNNYRLKDAKSSPGAFNGVRITVTCPGGKVVGPRYYKGAGKQSIVRENLIKKIKQLYKTAKDGASRIALLKTVVDVDVNFRLTGTAVQCCPVKITPKKPKKKSKDSLSDGNNGLQEQFSIELSGQATDEGALRLMIDGIQTVVSIEKEDSAWSTLSRLADDLSYVDIKALRPFALDTSRARLVVISDQSRPVRIGAVLDLDAETGLKVEYFAAECYDTDDYLLGDSSASAFVSDGAESLMLMLRERGTGTAQTVSVPIDTLENLRDSLFLAAPLDDVSVETVRGGVFVRAQANTVDTALVEGIAVHGATAQILSVGADSLDSSDVIAFDNFVTVIDGIGKITGNVLADLGVITLTDFTRASDDKLTTAGLTLEKIATFQAIADILLASPSLTADDAEVLVSGLNITSARELVAQIGSLDRERIDAAATRVRTKEQWTASRLLALQTRVI